MPRMHIVLPAILAALLMATSHSRALDLGLTPNHVYDLWININEGLVASARLMPDRRATLLTFADLEPRRFVGKTPVDVLPKVTAVRNKLNLLRKRSGLGAIDTVEGNARAVTPSVVFLNSGRILDGLAEWLIHRAGPELLISPFFVRHKVIGKTPSDVFGLVDLANRRLDALLARSGSSQG